MKEKDEQVMSEGSTPSKKDSQVLCRASHGRCRQERGYAPLPNRRKDECSLATYALALDVRLELDFDLATRDDEERFAIFIGRHKYIPSRNLPCIMETTQPER